MQLEIEIIFDRCLSEWTQHEDMCKGHSSTSRNSWNPGRTEQAFGHPSMSWTLGVSVGIGVVLYLAVVSWYLPAEASRLGWQPEQLKIESPLTTSSISTISRNSQLETAFPAMMVVPSPELGSKRVWKTICEEFRNQNLVWEGVKLDMDWNKSIRRQKYQLSAQDGWWRQSFLRQGRGQQEGKLM